MRPQRPDDTANLGFLMQDTRRAGKSGTHRGRSSTRPSRRPPIFRSSGITRQTLQGQSDLLIAATYVVLVGLLGGGLANWGAAYALVTVITIPFAVLVAWRDGFRSLADVPLAGRIGLIGVALLPLVQLIPLPPALWHALPGQALRRGTLALAGLDNSWQPLSIEPSSTALVAILAVGFVALVAALLRLDDAHFRRMLQLAVVLVLAGIFVGLMQVVSDGHPQLVVDNMGATMLGFFANKNHMALAIACSILLVGFPVARDLFGREWRRPVTIAFVLLALVAIVTTNSRAGLILGGLAVTAVLADQMRGMAMRWRLAVAAGGVLLVVGVLSSAAFREVSGRVGEVDDDLRWRFIEWSLPLAEQYWLAGSGFGSFATLFAAHERLEWVKPTAVNAAHNDYLQLVIEGGLPGVAVLLALLAGLAVAALRGLRRLERRDPTRRALIAGSAMVLLCVLHSAVDYPLRRPAAWIFLALAIAAIVRAGRSELPPSAAPAAPVNDPA